MPTEKAYQIANDVVTALFTNGANQKARRLVLKLEGERNGGGWVFQAARDHVAEVIEKHIASIGAVEHGVQRTGGTCSASYHTRLRVTGIATCDRCGESTSR